MIHQALNASVYITITFVLFVCPDACMRSLLYHHISAAGKLGSIDLDKT